MPVRMDICVRATPSISQVQQTVSLQRMQEEETAVRGRHDPCILARVTPVIEAMAAIGIMELWKERGACIR